MGYRPKASFPESVEVRLEQAFNIPSQPHCGVGVREKWGSASFWLGWRWGCMDVGVEVFTLGIPRWPSWWNKPLRQEGPGRR